MMFGGHPNSVHRKIYIKKIFSNDITKWNNGQNYNQSKLMYQSIFTLHYIHGSSYIIAMHSMNICSMIWRGIPLKHISRTCPLTQIFYIWGIFQ